MQIWLCPTHHTVPCAQALWALFSLSRVQPSSPQGVGKLSSLCLHCAFLPLTGPYLPTFSDSSQGPGPQENLFWFPRLNYLWIHRTMSTPSQCSGHFAITCSLVRLFLFILECKLQERRNKSFSLTIVSLAHSSMPSKDTAENYLLNDRIKSLIHILISPRFT